MVTKIKVPTTDFEIELKAEDWENAKHDNLTNDCVVATALKRVYGEDIAISIGLNSGGIGEFSYNFRFNIDSKTEKLIRYWCNRDNKMPESVPGHIVYFKEDK